jgi:hypothetical protein
MTNAAREGANYLVYHPNDVAINFAESKFMVLNEIKNSGLDIPQENIQIQCLDVTIDEFGVITNEVVDPTCTGRTTVEVIITLEHNVTIFSYLTGPISMHSSARMVIP